MRDTDIRSALDDALRRVHAQAPDTLIRHELGLCAGRRRVDLAVLNGEIAGYEIKSDEDTLTRLAGQVEAYGQVLDRAVLVTTERHVDKALAKLPDWWGVVVARQEDGVVVLDSTRTGVVNTGHDPFAIAQLLWREEALDELRQRGLGRGLSRKARHYIWVALADAVELVDLQAVVRQRLKERQDWPGGQ